MATYLPTIGMEIHFHLKTKSKMFCGCANEYLAAPNKNICPVCTAQPGTLPVPNAQAIEWVGLIGLALGSKLAAEFCFERKNYFYPDLPKGYQITSANQPPCIGGSIQVGNKRIRINHVHLEEDTGSLKHSADGTSSLVDLNRAGAPLVELVSEADMTNGWEAKTFCQELQLILRTLGVADADMEKGQMRCEVNISVRPEGQKAWGTKVEIKNLNSFRTVEKAIDHEIERQSGLLDAGQEVGQETRGWDEKKQQTVSQRTKESAHDYRYFPEPDIPPLTFNQDRFEQLQAELPELPIAKRQRFETEYGFTAEDARLLTADAPLASFVEHTISELQEWAGSSDIDWATHRPALMKLLGGWLTSELFKLTNEHGATAADLKITPENFAEFILMVFQKKVNSTAGQQLLRLMYATAGDPSTLLAEHDLAQTGDVGELTAAAQKVIAEYPEQVAQYRAGKVTVIQFFIGQVMKATRGKADPEVVHTLLQQLLDN